MQHDSGLITQLGDGIVQIRLPMAGNPLRYINGYLLEDDAGYTLVDCGWKADDVLAALHEALGLCGISFGDIARVAITHAHFDHYGLAGTLQRAGLPQLLMHRLDWHFAQLLLSDPVLVDRAADEWIARNGLVIDESLDEDVHYRRTELAVPTRELEDGDRIGRLQAVWTPGHTPGHLCFLDSRSGKLLVGDHILDPITPHVGVWGDRGDDPLGAYVASLQKVAMLATSGALPAHGEPFDHLVRRTDELLAHEATREAHVIAALEGGATSAADVARALPWTRRNRTFDELDPAHRQFAVAETLAHLEHLRARTRAVRDRASEPYGYTLA